MYIFCGWQYSRPIGNDLRNILKYSQDFEVNDDIHCISTEIFNSLDFIPILIFIKTDIYFLTRKLV